MPLGKQKIDLVLWIGIFTTIVVIPSLLDPINLPKLFVLTLGAGTLLGVFWNEICRQIKSGPRAITSIAGIFLCALLLTSIFGSQVGIKVLIGAWGRNNGLLTYLALVVIFFVLALQRSSYPGMTSIKFLSHLGSAGAVYGSIQSVGADPINWENTGNQVILTLGNSNFAGAFLALSAVASLVHLTMIRQTLSKLCLLVSFLIQIYLIFKSEAVQGLIIVFFGCTLFAGLALSNSTNQFFRRISLVVWSATILSGATAILSINNVGPFANLVSPYTVSLKDRYYHWIAAVNMIREYPVFGVGIDSFGEYYRRFRVQEAIDARGTAAFGTNNAHNVFLQIGSTGGLVLLTAYLALIFFIFYRAIFALRFSQQKNLVAGLFSIWLAFQVQSLVSIDQIGLVVWGWATAGCLVSLSYINSRPGDPKNSKDKKQKFTSLQRQKPNVMLILFGLLPAALLIPTIQNELTLRSQIVRMANSESLTLLKENGQKVLTTAARSNQPELALQTVDYLLRAELTEEALALSIKSTSKFPNSFATWNATAEIYEKMGQKSKAISYRKRTVELDPLNSEVKRLLEEDMASN
jgi:O-antigen ligase